jgi:hypothetical protein
MSADAVFDWDKQKWDSFVKRIKKHLSSEETDKVLAANAYRGHRRMVEIMPKRTGALGRSWYVNRARVGEYQIASMSKIALFIEEGTKAHGPRVKKYLYIPLRPGAAVWRKGFVWGRDYILVKRVKGIKARHYLKPITVEIFNMMVKDFSAHLAKAA